jgi:raffinose/stachyose/melibiose transport system permease protein
MSIPEELFESALIDGASSYKIFTAIVFPLLWEVIQITIVLAVTHALKSFAHAWALTEGGPGNSSSYLTIFMFKKSFLSFNFGYGSTAAITISIYALVFTVVFRRLTATDVYS